MPARTREQSLWTTIFIANLLILAALVLAALVYKSPAFRLPDERMVFLASVALLGVFVWTVWSWKVVSGSLFNPYILFLFSAYLFNGGQTFLEIFGLNKFGILDGAFSQETILKTTFLVTIGFLSFHAGALLGALFLQRKGARAESDDAGPATTAQATRLVGWGLLAVSIVPAVLTVKANLTLSLSVGYMAMLTQEVSRGYGAAPAILATAIIPAVIFLAAGSRHFKPNVRLATAIVVIYCVTLFLAGQRGTATMLLIAYVWVCHRGIRAIPRWALLSGGAFLFFFVFPVISVLRSNMTGGGRLSPGNFLETFLSIDNPLIAPLSETGFSMTTVAYTVDLIPGARAFDWGASYFYGVLGIFPNLFWDVHPSLAHGTPSIWLLETVAPSAVILGGWGLGYSFIAEAYFNFGWFGAPIALGAIGFFMGWFVLWAERSGDPAKIAAVGAFTAFVLIFARGEFLGSFGRPLVWYSLIPYWSVLLLMLFSKPKPHEAENTPKTQDVGGSRSPIQGASTRAQASTGQKRR